MARDGSASSRPSVGVFAPSPVLSVTVEKDSHDEAEIHLHAGGQGAWIANMVGVLGARAMLCAPFGGETGRVLRALLEPGPLELREVPAAAPNGCFVEDRRSGEVRGVAAMPSGTLDRHEADTLVNEVMAAALEAGVAVLTGPSWTPPVPVDLWRRLATDLGALDVTVVADLSGDQLDAALEGGLGVLKVSDEDLVEDGRAGSRDLSDLVAAAEEMRGSVRQLVVVTRAGEPALALMDDRALAVQVPELEVVDHRGAGDSMTAGIATALARGQDLETAVRLGAAAGAVNVTRHGLATGHREAIEQLAERVEIEELSEKEVRRARAHHQ